MRPQDEGTDSANQTAVNRWLRESYAKLDQIERLAKELTNLDTPIPSASVDSVAAEEIITAVRRARDRYGEAARP